MSARKHSVRLVLFVSGGLLCLSSHAQLGSRIPRGEAVERHLSGDEVPAQWVLDSEYLETQRGDSIELREVAAEALETVKLTGLVPPIRFASGVADVPDGTIAELREILAGLENRRNVRLHLVGHADDQPLSARLARVFGDNEGLSRERAGEVAEFLQRSLSLPPEAVTYEWAGDSQPIASNATPEGRALNRRVEVEVWYDEVGEAVAIEDFVVTERIDRIKVCRMETLCKLSYVEGQERRARVRNLIAPLRYDEESVEVTPGFVERVRQALSNLGDKRNVVVRFVGFTDDAPLTGRAQRIYGSHAGLSAAHARRAALAVQEALGLPTSAIESDGRGAVQPLGSNATDRGRALNRRVEVEFWYDDPLQELPDDLQVCPIGSGDTLVTRVYDPPWGGLARIEIVDGQPAIPAGLVADLGRAMNDVADETNVRLRFAGYTRNERLDRRTADIYGDDVGLSAARARRTAEAVAGEMGLAPGQIEVEGRGFVHSGDVVNVGFVQGDSSYVVAEVVYDTFADSGEYDGVDITPLARELAPQNPYGLNLMRITVDGEPIDDPARSSADIQRCTDVALDEADIRFGFDNLRASPRLGASANPTTVAVLEAEKELFVETDIRFSMYSNYAHFIERAEIRIFDREQSVRDAPLDIVEIDVGGVAEWAPMRDRIAAPLRELKYVLRAYGQTGTYDETAPQPLWLTTRTIDEAAATKLRNAEALEIYEHILGLVPESAAEAESILAADPRLLASYGENELAVRNIALSSGTVTVQGSGIPAEHSVWVAGEPVPVDRNGDFIAETILPTGLHTVEVAVLDAEGSGELFLRDLQLETNDWFYVGMADLTLSDSDVSGPMQLLQGENPQTDLDASAHGRLAFYVDGKFGEQWRLSASADTREEPLGDLFGNFMNKSPESLFRRIDPDYHYPTFGDDGTVGEGAPTLGRFYTRLEKEDNYGMWGNFNVGYLNNELAHVDRGLYGGMFHFESPRKTGFGEDRLAFDAFTAEPGTVSSREEFRGTGGSLYFLRRQDVLTGSERVRIELRDKVSGVVMGVLDLRPVLDYDIDYLQGRILLSEPLASTVDDGLLVRGNSLDGHEAYLVVRYEYAPGLDEIDAMSVGGQVHYWVNDYLKVGFTDNTNEQGDTDSHLTGADVTVRKSEQTWLKLQAGDTEGFLTSTVRSDDGGFGFSGYDDASFLSAEAGASRADISVGLSDFFGGSRGRLTVYGQEVEAGYAAPGLATLTDTRTSGGSFSMPVTDRLSLTARSDRRVQDLGIETDAKELDVEWQLNENWALDSGVRDDMRRDSSPVVPLTQEEGERRDAVLQLSYDSREQWRAYGFLQDTLETTGTREENGRFGMGGAYRISERLNLDLEISDGDLGRGGRVGTNYKHSDRTNLYLNYALENDRTDNALRSSRGSEGRLVAGVKTRFSDSTSVFLEERYQDDDVFTGLTHSTGISFAPADRLNLSANTDIGTLRNVVTGAETERTAAGLQIGYGLDAVQFSSGIEYRLDEAEQPDLSLTERRTWLFRNNFKYQLSPSARLLGKLNHSESESSEGQFYDGRFTEAVVGFAYRPVRHDRLNAITKYTYFYNVPTTDQITLRGTSAEFLQKSRIASVDVNYDIRERWSVGGKYAYRVGEMSLDRENPEFFDNGAELWVLRADWEFRENWEALVETRLLSMSDIGDERSGSLLVVSRYLGRHVKVGLGYSFASFSDDLTDLSFDHEGAFLNVTGAM